MDVGINPACADVALAAQINGFPRKAVDVAHRGDFAVLERDITDRIVHQTCLAQE